MSAIDDQTTSSPPPPPPWQVVVLVAHYLDPKTLAIASCVSKSWSISMSSDHLWKPLCSTHFPSLSNLRATTTTTTLPYRHLFALGHQSTQRRLRSPKKPHLSLDNITFAIDIHHRNSPPVTLLVPGDGLVLNSNDLFRFDIDATTTSTNGNINVNSRELVFGSVGEIKVTLNAVLNGLEGVFNVMDCKGEGSFVTDSDGWFSEELPMPGCCASGVTSGLVAEVKLGLKGKAVEKVGLGVINIISWRYVGVDDVLRYLQHFLILP